MRWDEQRKSMQQDAQAKAQLAQYNDELARKRLEVGAWAGGGGLWSYKEESAGMRNGRVAAAER